MCLFAHLWYASHSCLCIRTAHFSHPTHGHLFSISSWCMYSANSSDVMFDISMKCLSCSIMISTNKNKGDCLMIRKLTERRILVACIDYWLQSPLSDARKSDALATSLFHFLHCRSFAGTVRYRRSAIPSLDQLLLFGRVVLPVL